MNNPTEFWEALLAAVRASGTCALLTVVESSGSSPGRPGFAMFVAPDGSIGGSIGGGSMEHKLVELARARLLAPHPLPLVKRQVHREGEGHDRSGMICSGEQVVTFHFLHTAHEEVLADIIASIRRSDGRFLALASTGLYLVDATTNPTDAAWCYSLPLGQRPCIAIIGGGHVGTALSQTMATLGFRVLQFDHRADLNTMENNRWAEEKHVVPFEHIEEQVPDDPQLYVAIVSFGYRTDEVVLRRLLRRRWKYLGLLGSQAKVDAMFTKLRADGYTQEELSRVHAPIGLPIHSRTPEEIAISIAAQIIAIKNQAG